MEELTYSTPYHYALSSSGTNANLVKDSRTALTSFDFQNDADYDVQIKLCDTNQTPVPGTTPIKKSIGVLAGGRYGRSLHKALKFNTGFGFYVVKEQTDGGTTGIDANKVVVDVDLT